MRETTLSTFSTSELTTPLNSFFNTAAFNPSSPQPTTVCPQDTYISQPSSLPFSRPCTPPCNPPRSPPICPGAPRSATFAKPEMPRLSAINNWRGATPEFLALPFPNSQPTPLWSGNDFMDTQSSSSAANIPGFDLGLAFSISPPGVYGSNCVATATSDENWLSRPLRFAREDYYCDRLALSPSPVERDDLTERREENDSEMDMDDVAEMVRDLEIEPQKAQTVTRARNQITTRSQSRKSAMKQKAFPHFQAEKTKKKRVRWARKLTPIKLEKMPVFEGGRGRSCPGMTHKQMVREESPYVLVDGLRRSRRLQELTNGFANWQGLSKSTTTPTRKICKAAAHQGRVVRRSKRLQKR